MATSYELQRLGIDHIVLERGEPGESWSSRVYDSLTLHTGKLMSSLPGKRFDRATPKFLPRSAFLDYLRRYRSQHELPVRERMEVTSLRREGDRWLVTAGGETLQAKFVVVATGIMSNPCEPAIRGREQFRGAIRHSSAYRNPSAFIGKRVLVVGCGNSGGEIASELGRAGVDTTISIRSGANVVPLHIAGVPIQYIAYYLRRTPRLVQRVVLGSVRAIVERIRGPQPFPRGTQSPLDAIPIIGFHLFDAVRAGSVRVRAGIESLTSRGVRFTDGVEEAFDEIVLATGFRAATSFLDLPADERGFAVRSDRVTSRSHPDLLFVGHNYDSTGALFNIRRDASLAARKIAAARG